MGSISYELEKMKQTLDMRLNGTEKPNYTISGAKPIEMVCNDIRKVIEKAMANRPSNPTEFFNAIDEDSPYYGKYMKDYEAGETDWADYTTQIATDISATGSNGLVWLPYDEDNMCVVFKYTAGTGIYYYIPNTFVIEIVNLSASGDPLTTYKVLEKLVALFTPVSAG